MNPFVIDIICLRNGAITPTLASLASSSLCCEKNYLFALHSPCVVREIGVHIHFVHSTRRNKVTPQNAEDLMYMHGNLRLLSGRTPEYLKEETEMWEIVGDSFDSFEDAGLLEVASLSLDESKLEAIAFTDVSGKAQVQDSQEIIGEE